MDRLQEILEDGIIDEIYSQLKTGKEAEVWLVSHRGEPVAAKLYKSREFRSFKNDSGYREGRQVRNSRTQRAMDRGSKFGREASEDAWKSAEADALAKLHAAGVRVPRPVLFYEGVLLMEVIGDAEGRVAPRLVDAQIPREHAQGLYASIRGEIIKMLSADLIHGDLSEFNILLSHDGPVIIDFPQVVMAAKNSQSEHYFRKDLGNIVRFFSTIDPAIARHASDVDEIWRAYVRRDLSAGFVPSGRSAAHPRPGGDQRQRGDQRQGADQRRGHEQRQGEDQRQGADQRRGHEQRGSRGESAPPRAAGDGARKPFAAAARPPRRGPEVTILGKAHGGPTQAHGGQTQAHGGQAQAHNGPPRNGQAPMTGSAAKGGQPTRNDPVSTGGRPQPVRNGPVLTGGQPQPVRNGPVSTGGQPQPVRNGQPRNPQGPGTHGHGDDDQRMHQAQGRRPARRF